MAAFDEELVVQGDADGLAGRGGQDGAVDAPGLDRLDLGAGVARAEQQGVAHAQLAALDAAGEDAALVELVDVLDREAQRQFHRQRLRRQGVQGGDQGVALEPGHVLRLVRQSVAVARGDRQDRRRGDAHAAEILVDLAGHFLEAVLGVVDQVHLVDRDHDVVEAEQVQDVAVAAGLLLDPFLGIDHQDGGIGRGGTGDHVLQKLLMARRVDDDVGAGRGLEEDLGCVDGDALVALGLQGVEHERPFHRHPAPVGHGLHRFHLAVGQGAGVVQHAADQGRLAVVHMADDDELHRREVGDRGVGHLG